jgi:hypothetical protein
MMLMGRWSIKLKGAILQSLTVSVTLVPNSGPLGFTTK